MKHTIPPMLGSAGGVDISFEGPLIEAAYILSMCPNVRGRVALQAVKDVVEILSELRGELVGESFSRKEDFVEAEEILREIDNLDQLPMFIIDASDLEDLSKMAWKLWQACLLMFRFRRTK